MEQMRQDFREKNSGLIVVVPFPHLTGMHSNWQTKAYGVGEGLSSKNSVSSEDNDGHTH